MVLQISDRLTRRSDHDRAIRLPGRSSADPLGVIMKRLRNLIQMTIFFLLLASHAWAGTEGLFVVYHLEKSSVSGEISLRPVEISFDTVSDPALAVFAEWRRPYLDKNTVVLEQTNKAYFKGLKVTTNASMVNLEVFLDYTACREDLEKISSKGRNSLLEATAAAILYTKNVPGIQPVKTVVMHVTGFFEDQPNVTKTYMWSKLQKKWKPYLGGFADILKK